MQLAPLICVRDVESSSRWYQRAAVQRAEGMNIEIVKPSHRSENLNWEFWLRDPDGYMIVLTSPLPGVINPK